MERPAPYPPDTRAKGWRFGFDVESIELSAGWALAENSLVKGAILMLLFEAFRQVPCGSLPGDDKSLCDLLRFKPDWFSRHRHALLRDWWLADDGRLYSTILIPQVKEMLANRARGWLKHRDAVMAAHGYQCVYCGSRDAPLALDHVVPRIQGGTDDPANLVPACKPCNSSKGGRTPEQWRGA